MTRKWFVRALYIFNVLLLLGICVSSLMFVSEKSKRVVSEKVASLCVDVAHKISVEGWSVQDAKAYVVEQAKFGDQNLDMTVTVESGEVWLETESPRERSGLLAGYFNSDEKINCSTS